MINWTIFYSTLDHNVVRNSPDENYQDGKQETIGEKLITELHL